MTLLKRFALWLNCTLFEDHVNADAERSPFDPPLYPVRCDHCGELFYADVWRGRDPQREP